MIEDYLTFGGNEVVNSARAKGYATTDDDCPGSWLVGPICDSLGEALGDGPYNYTDITSAPWFDPANPDVTSRFYGVYGLGIEGIYDSTATVGVTEGIDDGGVIGRERSAVKDVRVRCFLSAKGRDAFGYGMAWLNSVLKPGACGQHGLRCGTTDAGWLAECPPPRGMVDVFTWQEQRRNYAVGDQVHTVAVGDAVETVGPAAGPIVLVATNAFANPSFETPADPVLAATNLVTNPSMETVSGTIEVRRNLHPNPVFATAMVGATAIGGSTVAHNTVEKHDGYNSVVVTTPGVGTSEGVSLVLTTQPVAMSGKSYSGGFWMKAPLGATLYATTRTVGAASQDSATVFVTGTGRWQWVASSVNVAQADATSLQVHLRTATTAQAITFYVTQALVEERTTPPPPGSFFSGTAQPAARRNMATVPRASATSWLTNNGAHYVMSVDNTVLTPAGNPTKRADRTSTAPSTALGSWYAVGTLGHSNAGWLPVHPGTQVTVSVDMLAQEPVNGQMILYFYTAAGAEITASRVNGVQPLKPNEWKRVAAAGTAPATAAFVVLGVSIFKPSGVTVGGEKCWIGDALVEYGTLTAGTYFDGEKGAPDGVTPSWEGAVNGSESRLTDGDLTPAWIGAPDASASWVLGAGVTGFTAVSQARVYSSSHWASAGSKSLRVVATGAGLDSACNVGTAFMAIMNAPGTYTFIGKVRLASALTAPNATYWGRLRVNFSGTAGSTNQPIALPTNAPGVYEVRQKITVVAGATVVGAYLYNGSGVFGEQVWWDDVALIAGDYAGPYFDGSNPPSDMHAVAWTGTADASTSTLSTAAVVAARNLMKNPSVEAARGSSPEVRRNLNMNPRLYSSINFWSQSAGTDMTMVASPEGAQMDVVVAHSKPSFHQGSAYVPVAVGEYYSSAMEVSVPPGFPALTFYLRTYSYGNAIILNTGPTVTINPGETKRIISQGGVPIAAGSTGVRSILYPSVTMPVGARFFIRNAILEKAFAVGDYFDGWTDNDPDAVSSWVTPATPDASMSVLTGTRPYGYGVGASELLVSREWAASGATSLRLITRYQTPGSGYCDYGSVENPNAAWVALERGKTYTAMVTVHKEVDSLANRGGITYTAAESATMKTAFPPNAAGDYDLRIVFTVGATGYGFLRVIHNGAAGEPDIWFDNFLVVEGNYTGPYFDGDNPPADADLGAQWTGAPYASPSAMLAVAPKGVTSPNTTVYMSGQWAAEDDSALVVLPNATADAYAELDAALAVNATYTVYGTLHLDAPGGTATYARSIAVEQGDAILTYAEAPNTAGDFDVQMTFTAGPTDPPTIRLYGSGDATTTARWDKVLIVEGVYTGDYFDGDQPDDGPYRFEWVGTPDDSFSLRYFQADVDDGAVRITYDTGPTPAEGAVTFYATCSTAACTIPVVEGQSVLAGAQMRSGVGGREHAMVWQFDYYDAADTLLTPVVLSAVVVPGAEAWTPVIAESIAPANAASVQVVLRSTSDALPEFAAGDYVEAKELIVTLDQPLTPFFDGDAIPPDVNTRYQWIDAAPNRYSIEEFNINDPVPQTDEEYARTVDMYRRYLHNVARRSGPFVLEEFVSADGRFHGAVVEFTLVAATPWIFSVTREVAVPTAGNIVVVQDIPYNLVSYPSAELASAVDALIATNYSLNPSVENNATGWASGSAVITPTATGAQSADLAVSGTKSLKVTTTATNAGADGYIYGAQNVALPPDAPGQRFSISAWGNAVVAGGTAVLGELSVLVDWQDGAAAILRQDVVGTLAAPGGAMSKRSLEPPDGAVTARVIVRADVDSWQVGAVLDLYVDALAVSVP